MNNKKILVVDDDIHIVHVVTIKLRNNGYDVISAENGADALILAQNECPDVIITDYQMPLMDGLELVEKLRQEERTKTIPIIMLTARSFAITPEKKPLRLRAGDRRLRHWQFENARRPGGQLSP